MGMKGGGTNKIIFGTATTETETTGMEKEWTTILTI
jgi:hypothetical protein